MSIRLFLDEFIKSVSLNVYDPSVAEAQRRDWLKDGLAEINKNHSISNSLATVEILANNRVVYLPRDYKLAEDEALFAVEYGYSGSYIEDQGLDSGELESISSPIYNPTNLRNLGEVLEPRVSRVNRYGVSRYALRMHKAFTSDRSEGLLYNALHEVTDPTQEVSLLSNPIGGTIISISSANKIDYEFVYSNRNSLQYQVLIGRTKSATAKNLAQAIERNNEDEDVTARSIGETVILTGYKSDVDFLVTLNENIFSLEQLESTNSLTLELQAEVIRWVQYRQYDYLATAEHLDLSDPARSLYLKKAKDIKESVLDALVCLS